mgnify:CR=1 FL=1
MIYLCDFEDSFTYNILADLKELNLSVTIIPFKETYQFLQTKITSKEKEVIQNDCKHKGDTFVQFDKSNSMNKYCSDCKRELGYPTKSEQEKFLGNKTEYGNS